MRYCSLVSRFCHSASEKTSLGASIGSDSFPSLLITRMRAVGVMGFLSSVEAGEAALAVGGRSQALSSSSRSVRLIVFMIERTGMGQLLFPLEFIALPIVFRPDGVGNWNGGGIGWNGIFSGIKFSD